MSAAELKEALDGPRGSLDGYLEARNESDIRKDIRDLCAIGPRADFAKAALQGICANPSTTDHAPADAIAEWAVEQADALLAELAK